MVEGVDVAHDIVVRIVTIVAVDRGDGGQGWRWRLSDDGRRRFWDKENKLRGLGKQQQQQQQRGQRVSTYLSLSSPQPWGLLELPGPASALSTQR